MSEVVINPVELGPFLVEARVGAGGMGSVWRGRHRAQGTPVAVKVITGQGAADPALQAAFRNEVRAAARLDHPNIVRLFDAGAIPREADRASGGALVAGSPYLVMELLTGGALEPQGPPGPWRSLRLILLDLLSALGHAHARGVVHRDLKPRNVLYAGAESDEPGLRLTDFGIAHAFTEQSDNPDDTEPDAIVGSPYYMAPEQHHNRWREQGPWTDLYALGIITWELLCGRRPYDGDLYAVVFGHLSGDPGPFEPRLDVPDGLQAWVRRLMAPESRDRFERAADAAFALVELSRGRRVYGLPPLPPTWRRPLSARRVAITLGGAGLGLHGLRSLPVLGRDRLLGTAWAALSDVWSRAEPRLLVLRGGVGRGTSRVAEYLAERAEEVGGAHALRVAHGPGGDTSRGLTGLLARTLRCHGLASDPLREHLRTWLGERGEVDEAEVDGLVALLAAPEPGGVQALRAVDPGERHELLLRVLRRLAAGRPLVLQVDDAQWAPGTLGFLEALLDHPAAGPVLVLVCVQEEALESRPEEAGRIAAMLARHEGLQLSVPPLDPDDAEQLARQVLGLSPGLAVAVVQRAAGKPRYIVDLVGDWAARGLLVPGRKGFTLAGDLDRLLPPDLHRLQDDRIERALEAHGPDARAALEVAAAMGIEIDAFEWNDACSKAGVVLDPELIDTVLAAGIGEATEAGFSLAGELVRSALERSSRAAGRWPSHHRACAAMLRRRYPSGRPGLDRRLGRHLLDAGELDEAVERFDAARAELVARGEHTQALAVVGEAERALHTSGAAAADPRWGRCLLSRTRAQLALGWLEPAAQSAAALQRRAEEHRWVELQAAALGERARVARLSGDMGGALALLGAGLKLTAGRFGATRAGLQELLAQLRRQACEYAESKALYAEARLLFEHEQEAHGEARCRLGIAQVLLEESDLDEAEAHFLALADDFERLGGRFGVAAALNGVASVAQLRGDLERARGGYERSWEVLVRLGSPAAITAGLNVAYLEASAGDLGALEQTLDRISAQGGSGSQRPWRGQELLFRLLLLGRDGQWDAWDEAMEQARALLAERAGPPRDIAAVALQVGDQARDDGEILRARMAWMVAREQLEQLDDLPAIREVDQRLA